MKVERLYLLASSLFYLLIFLLKLHSPDGIVRFCIPLFVLCTCIYSIHAAHSKGYLISLALLFAFAGDTLINLSSVPQFSMVTFIITHLLLTIYYYKKRVSNNTNTLRYLLLSLIASLGFFLAMQSDITSSTLKVALAIYLIFLTLMLWQALCFLGVRNLQNTHRHIIIGSVLFYCTDLAVCLYLVYHLKAFSIITWLLYPPALVLLSSIEKPILNFIKTNESKVSSPI